MSVAVQYDVRDYATKAIEVKLAKCSPRWLGAIIGRPLAEFWRNRLASLGTNKRGWPSTKFYERAARSVTHLPSDEGVTLRADHQGLRQRWRGGRITAVNARMLTIPISPVSYGHRASEFPGAFLLRTKKGAFIVQAGESLSEAGRLGKTKNAGGHARRRLRAALNFLFVLKRSVDQAGDDRVVPTNDEFAEVAMARIEEAIK